MPEGYIANVRDTAWPIRIKVGYDYDSDAQELMLNEAEAEAYQERLETLLIELQSAETAAEMPVRVQILRDSADRLYTYNDPSDSLEPGDLVMVPVGPSNTMKVASVVKLGRGDYKGLIKDVGARLEEVSL